MILADIRIQFILALFGLLALASLLLPDRYGRGVSKSALILTGFLTFGFLAAAPQIHAGMGPLPAGAAADGNFWVWLAEFRDRPSALSTAALGAYAVAGVAWAICYFWLYARRLGQMYVMERDAWLRRRNLASLESLPPDDRADFERMLMKVKGAMLYEGDFPLAPLQQKRFFIANSMLWPVTLLVYLVGDMAVDAARYVWFALRNWIHRRWEAGMSEYMKDQALCRGLIVEEAVAQAH